LSPDHAATDRGTDRSGSRVPRSGHRAHVSVTRRDGK
jgi:hypothetical protein